VATELYNWLKGRGFVDFCPIFSAKFSFQAFESKTLRLKKCPLISKTWKFFLLFGGVMRRENLDSTKGLFLEKA
jgi:hypothetical protein